MRRAGHLDLDASHRWSAMHRSASPFGHARTLAVALRQPAADALMYRCSNSYHIASVLTREASSSLNTYVMDAFAHTCLCEEETSNKCTDNAIVYA
jgi:hypothetical protein